MCLRSKNCLPNSWGKFINILDLNLGPEEQLDSRLFNFVSVSIKVSQSPQGDRCCPRAPSKEPRSWISGVCVIPARI